MGNYASKVIQIAEAEVGYLEKATNSNLDDKIANAGKGNYTKYARDLDAISGFYNGKKNGYAWCDIFVDWLFVKAFGVEAAKTLLYQPNNSYGAGCTYSARYYKQKGQFYTSNPKPGDQIFFGNVDHTGIVYKVDNTYVYTIEGNTSGASGVVANGGGVYKKKYSLNYNKIHGYGRPKYDEEVVLKSLTEIAREVIDNKWGSGSTRKSRLTAAGYNYDEVQKKVNELLKPAVKDEYTLKEFVEEVQRIIGADVDGIAGPETISKTKTLSTTINRRHNLVVPVQKRLKQLDYNVGDVDGIYGSQTKNAVIEFQRKNGCSKDGVITAKNKTWRKLLGMV